MDYQQRVAQHFSNSINDKQGAADNLTPSIVAASEIMTTALLQGKKILCCGTAGSSAFAQYFASALLNRHERERPGLPAISLSADSQALSTIAAEHSFREIFAKQIKVLGSQGDILVTLSSSGSARPTVEAIVAAHDKDMQVIALTGPDADSIADTLDESDIHIMVPVLTASRVKEVHLLVLHSFCDLIDLQIFGEE